MKRTWTIAFSLLGALLAGGLGTWVAREPYVSQALVAAKPALLPPSVLPAEPIGGRDINQAAHATLSRASLGLLVDKFDLYAADRARLPREDVLESMRKEIRIERAGEHLDAWRISYVYTDRVKAQQTAQDIAASLVREVKEYRRDRLGTGIDFLRNQLFSAPRGKSARASVPTAAEAEFAKLVTIRTSQSIPGEAFRPQLAELTALRPTAAEPPDARRQEVQRQQLAQLQIMLQLHEQGHGEQLQLLDPASLPPENNMREYAPWSVVAAALLGALPLGACGWWLDRRRAYGSPNMSRPG